MSDNKVIKHEVYNTKDYDKFKRLIGNRKLDTPDARNHIKHIAESMEANPHLLPLSPIWVRSDMTVIDGQNRLEAAKLKKLPVYYIFVDDLDINDVHIINSTNKAWTIEDYAESYAELGKENYKNLVAIMQKGIRCTIAIRLFYPSGYAEGHHARKAFKSGNFNPPVSFDEVKRRAAALLEIAAIEPKFLTIGHLAAAWVTLQNSPEYEQEQMVERLIVYKNTRDVERPGSLEAAKRLIEEIYNYRNVYRKRLY